MQMHFSLNTQVNMENCSAGGGGVAYIHKFVFTGNKNGYIVMLRTRMFRSLI